MKQLKVRLVKRWFNLLSDGEARDLFERHTYGRRMLALTNEMVALYKEETK